jgi:small-conductance mechanosensitive channel
MIDLNELQSWIQLHLGLGPGLQIALLRTLAVIVVLIALRLLAVMLLYRRVRTDRGRYRTRQITTYVSTTIALLLIGRIWFAGIGDITTYLGLLSAGVAIALRDPLVSMAGWLHILWRRPFDVGDRIAVGEHAGDVIDLRLFRFSVLEIGNWVPLIRAPAACSTCPTAWCSPR